VAEAEGQILVIPLSESVAGGDHIDEMLDVPGVDVFFFGPADYSATAGYPGQWEGPGVAEKILDVASRIRARGKQCGVMATSNENLLTRRDQGFRMLGLGADAGLLLRSLHESLAAVGRDRLIVPSLSVAEPSPGQTMNNPLPRPPELMRPDRPEVMIAVGEGSMHEVAPGVRFEELVGGGTGARGLTTGIVTFAPGGRLPYHRHTFDESLTLLQGKVTIEVDGRSYTLDPLDNVTIPSGVAHAATNPSSDEPATVHIAMATDSLSRELVDGPANHRRMSDDTHGRVGPEYVTRFRLARRHCLGDDAWFTDYCNGDLLSGTTLSGGYGTFDPAGRLPAHLHDFDESICIVEGEATCVVEGRRYRLADGATALQPRGRVHYFVNESNGPMGMIWFYAGPYPKRIVVDERCATLSGDPWKEEIEP
jgi:quercetin dioxygenase-like cupin family protein